MDFSIFSSFLPEGLLSHFDIVEFKELGDLQTKKDCFYGSRKKYGEKS